MFAIDKQSSLLSHIFFDEEKCLEHCHLVDLVSREVLIRVVNHLKCLCLVYKKRVVVKNKSNLLLKIIFAQHMKITTIYN